MAKLVAIGDSLSQGFQSGAVFYTDLSFPALMARSMGLEVPTQFRVPRFPGSGLPINIEYLLRWMQTRLGPDIETCERDEENSGHGLGRRSGVIYPSRRRLRRQ